jgi:probable HAF family extracellular repeat protein
MSMGHHRSAEVQPMKRRQVLGMGACGLLLAGCGLGGGDDEPAGDPPRYSLADLGRIGSTEVLVAARNDAGDTTGQAIDTSGVAFAYAHVGGRMVNLSSLYPGSVSPLAINAQGWVVGRCTPDDPSDVVGMEPERPFVYDGTTLRALRAEIGEGGEANSINATGLMVGRTNVMLETDDNRADAFSYDGLTLRLLGHLGSGRYAQASAVDRLGRVTGSSLVLPEDGSGWPPEHAFLHDGHTMLDLGTLGGRNSSGLAIDAEAGVTGYAEGADRLARAFVHDRTRMQDFGLFAGRRTTGLGIHRSGRIVGYAGHASDDDRVALVSHAGAMHDLNRLVDAIGDWHLLVATSIDAAGRILALGRRGTQARRTALLTPL